MGNTAKVMVIVLSMALLSGAAFQSGVLAADTGSIDAVSGKPCFKCHQSKVTAPFVHSGLAGRECTPCHNASGGNHQADRKLYAVKDKSSKVCYECHEDQTKKKSVHGPIMEDSCLGCHAPHAAKYKFQLGTTVPDLCFGCHDRALILEKDTQKATGYRDGTSNLHYLHAGEKNGIPCLACHDVHASDQPHLLRPKGANGKEAVTLTYKEITNGGNCTVSCHDSLEYVRK